MDIWIVVIKFYRVCFWDNYGSIWNNLSLKNIVWVFKKKIISDIYHVKIRNIDHLTFQLQNELAAREAEEEAERKRDEEREREKAAAAQKAAAGNKKGGKKGKSRSPSPKKKKDDAASTPTPCK